MIRRFLPLVMILVLHAPGFATPVKEIEYSGLGNFKALYASPNGRPPFPCIIYVYDQFVDWNGLKFAIRQGYDLPQFAASFADNGYVSIIPIERFRKMESIRGAVSFAQSLPFVDRKRIFLVGMSEGGFMTIMALKALPEVRGAVVINPRSPNDTGYFSMGSALADVSKIKVPVTFYMSRADITRSRSDSLQLFHGMRNSGVKVHYFEKNVGPKWFWNPSQEFFTDTLSFFER